MPDHRTTVVWDEELARYDFGSEHPMSPVRLTLTVELARALGVLHAPGVQVVPAPVPPTDELVLTAHDAAYVTAVRRASAHPAHPSSADHAHGLGTDDVPLFEGMHAASSRVLAATVACAEAVWRGGPSGAQHAVNISGGMHHAARAAASGFCVYNDLVAGIARLLALGARRVAYVDVDAHHGDGVEEAFWDDPRVLTASVHEDPATLFPGTGRSGDVGGTRARGTAVNVPVPPGTGDDGWLWALHAVVLPVVRAFAPDVLVTQHGCDSHRLDPLAHLELSTAGQLATTHALHALAHEVAGGRWVATGGGGYEVTQVVPRAWTHLIAVAAHAPVDPATPVPEVWRRRVERSGRAAPALMGEDAGPRVPRRGGHPLPALERAVAATRAAVLPWHGLEAVTLPGPGRGGRARGGGSGVAGPE